jgi:outer membrane protein
MTRPDLRKFCLFACSAPLALALLAGCRGESPFQRESERAIRDAVIDSARRELGESQQTSRSIVVTREAPKARLAIMPELLPELEQMAGIASYRDTPPMLGVNLYGEPVEAIMVNLEQLIRSAVERNIAVEFARLSPAVTQAQISAAEAAFDWTLFQNLNWTNQDSPRVGTAFVGSAPSPRVDVQQSLVSTTGLRRTMVSGGRMTVQQELSYVDNNTPGQANSPNPAQQAAFTLQVDQPLLRNFGSDVTQAEIRVLRNAERGAVQVLKRDLIRVVTETERGYWDLVLAYHELKILTRLLERGEQVRDQLRERVRLDANRAQIADAVSRVERRKVDVMRAQTNIRIISDRIKALVNDPALPIGSEIILAPADEAVDQQIKFSLVESLRIAIQNRPEVQQAILAIDDASIRQVVSDNQRLPDLTLRLQARWASLDDNLGQAIGSEFNGNFVDYLVGAAFEIPVGNRRAEAEYRRRRLERMQSVLAYRNTLQQIVAEVKTALYRTLEAYRQISQTEDARLAAAESLRILQVEKEIDQGITVERLEVELNSQERLAIAEREEAQARVGYNAQLSDLFAAMGTTLQRNRINFVAPTSADVPWDLPNR